jgi:hypothetical protein
VPGRPKTCSSFSPGREATYLRRYVPQQLFARQVGTYMCQAGWYISPPYLGGDMYPLPDVFLTRKRMILPNYIFSYCMLIVVPTKILVQAIGRPPNEKKHR